MRAKLLKDLPFLPKGSVFVWVRLSSGWSGYSHIVNPGKPESHYLYTAEEVENLPEWFEILPLTSEEMELDRS